MIDLLILTFFRIGDFSIIYEKSQNLKSIGKIHIEKYGVEPKFLTHQI